jgi:hypothetical protein
MASDSPPAPLEIENIPLPPHPGLLEDPDNFCRKIPKDSRALFSTHGGTRPVRSLPDPSPPRVLRTGLYESHESDVRKKAFFLLRTYPDIAQTIVIPPVSWEDLYHYFDGMDIWTEGAWFLFCVLGDITRVNLTRVAEIEVYCDAWVRENEMRLMSLPELQQSTLGSVFSINDHAWFDVDNMTRHEKTVLATKINSRRATLLEAQASLQAACLRQSERVATHNRRPIGVMQADPYQHFGRIGKQSGVKFK